MYTPMLSMGMIASAGRSGGAFANSLLLEMNGADNSTIFTDSSVNNHGTVVYGDAKISTSWSIFGGAGGLLDGNGDYLEIADHPSLRLGVIDWTTALYIRPLALPSTSAGAGVIGKRDQTGNTADSWMLVFNQTTGTLSLVELFGGGFVSNTMSESLSLSTNYHIELSRSVNTIRGFVNGVQRLSYTTSHNFDGGTNPISIGRNATGYLNAHLDYVSITKGLALHTADFTPPGI